MKHLCVVLVMVLGGAVTVGAGDGDAILGLWATDPEGEGGQAHVEIYAVGDSYSGKIVWLEEPLYTEDDTDGEYGQPKVDKNNPEAALKSRPIMGLVIMQDFQYDGEGIWKKGTIYDPDNGKTYKCKLRLVEDDVLNVRGFIGVSLIGRTSHWTRVEVGK